MYNYKKLMLSAVSAVLLFSVQGAFAAQVAGIEPPAGKETYKCPTLPLKFQVGDYSRISDWFIQASDNNIKEGSTVTINTGKKGEQAPRLTGGKEAFVSDDGRTRNLHCYYEFMTDGKPYKIQALMITMSPYESCKYAAGQFICTR